MLDGSFLIGLLALSVADDLAGFRIVENRRVETNCVLRFAALFFDEHQSRRDLLIDRPAAGEHHLPRETVAVLEPSVTLAERILAELHERRAALRQFPPERIHCRRRLARDEKGD